MDDQDKVWLNWKQSKEIMNIYGVICSKVNVRNMAEKYGFFRANERTPFNEYEQSGLEEWLSRLSGKGDMEWLQLVLNDCPPLKRKNAYAQKLILMDMGIKLDKKYGRLYVTIEEGEIIRAKYRGTT